MIDFLTVVDVASVLLQTTVLCLLHQKAPKIKLGAKKRKKEMHDVWTEETYNESKFMKVTQLPYEVGSSNEMSLVT